MADFFSLNVLQTALEVGLIYALVAMALFVSFSILNIADLSTDGCFTLGCAVGAMLTIAGHPILCLLYTSPSPRDLGGSRMPSSA